jgi:hypothetical protein
VIVCYLDLADYLAIVTEVTGLDVETPIRVTNTDLADSALHAPQAGWGETDLHPDFVDKAAVLVTPPHEEPSSSRRQQAGSVGGPAGVHRAERLTAVGSATGPSSSSSWLAATSSPTSRCSKTRRRDGCGARMHFPATRPCFGSWPEPTWAGCSVPRPRPRGVVALDNFAGVRERLGLLYQSWV